MRKGWRTVPTPEEIAETTDWEVVAAALALAWALDKAGRPSAWHDVLRVADEEFSMTALGEAVKSRLPSLRDDFEAAVSLSRELSAKLPA